jgi:hypothetical protein
MKVAKFADHALVTNVKNEFTSKGFVKGAAVRFVAAHKITVIHGRLRERVPVTIHKDQMGQISGVDLEKLEVQVDIKVHINQTEKTITASVPQSLLDVQRPAGASGSKAAGQGSEEKLISDKGLAFLNSGGGKSLEVTLLSE